MFHKRASKIRNDSNNNIDENESDSKHKHFKKAAVISVATTTEVGKDKQRGAEAGKEEAGSDRQKQTEAG